jgi:hypothetical protein
MSLERRQESTLWGLSVQLSRVIKNRTPNAIQHKLKEIISKQDYPLKEMELLGKVYPVESVSGYFIITLPDGKKTPAHHFVFCEFNKCGIPEGYVVHHINAKPYDNNPNNLLLMSSSDHIKLHKGGSLPETTALFYYLQEMGLWESYLNWRVKFITNSRFLEI